MSTTTNPEAPLRVNSVRILGTEATRNSFLNSVTSGVFNASTTQDVIAQVKQVAAQLQKHDIFDEIKVYLDTNHKVNDTVDMTLHLKEKNKGVFSTNFSVGNNEADLNGGVGVRNVLGGAEFAHINYSFGNRTKAAVEGVLETPFRGSANAKMGIFLNGSIRDHSQINAFKENAKATGVRFTGSTEYGEHQLAYAITHRNILALQKASASVRSQSGSNIKHSVFHSFVRDERDNAILPTQGHYLGLFQELAGLGGQGNINYVKHELNASYHQPLSQSLVFSTSARAGIFTSVGEDDNGPHLADRFYLGGPLSVRGFKMGGIGERNGNDAVGGEAYWAAGASLIGTIPGLAHLPVKAHAFANAGSIVTKNQGDIAKQLSETPRTSVGFGFILHHAIGRVEANYCIPLRYSASDLPQPKIQIGFGVNFL